VVKLARLPGARESRWAHLLSGAPAEEVAGPGGGSAEGAYASHDASLGEVTALKANVARLEAELVSLKALVGRVCSELGISEAG